MILVLDEQEVRSSLDAKEEEMEKKISWFSDDEEEFLWIESRKESHASRVDASEGESLLRSKEFESGGLGRASVPMLIW